jgi:iduronate 2-sulfatase
VLADYAISELQRLQARPFFMAIGFTAPNLPFTVPKAYWDLHQQTELTTLRHWPTGMPEVAENPWSELRNYTGIPNMGLLDSELSRNLARGYYAGVSFVDEQIGRVLNELDRLELNKNTIVILCSDHGYKLGDYGAWSKFTSHDIDLHTPLIMMGPGIPANTATNSLVELVDIVPTLSSLCGFAVPTTNEGLSLTPLFNDPGSAWKKAVYSLTPRGTVIGYSMRTDRWRYTEWITGDLDEGSHEVMGIELYDHQSQTLVSRNLADLPENRDLMKLLGQQLRCGWKHVRPGKSK